MNITAHQFESLREPYFENASKISYRKWSKHLPSRNYPKSKVMKRYLNSKIVPYITVGMFFGTIFWQKLSYFSKYFGIFRENGKGGLRKIGPTRLAYENLNFFFCVLCNTINPGPGFLAPRVEIFSLTPKKVTHWCGKYFIRKNRFLGSKIAVFDFLELRIGFLRKQYTFWKKLLILINFSSILKFSPNTSPKIQNRRKIGQN